MKKSEIEKCCRAINKVLNSRKSKLNIKDREQLIIAREELTKAKSEKDLIGPLKILARLAGIAAEAWMKLKK